MSPLLILLQVHLVGLLVCILILHTNLPKAVRSLIKKNSFRMDGTFSRRRNEIEKMSFAHSLFPLYPGVAFAFLLTAFIGLSVSNLKIPLPLRFDEMASPTEFEPLPASEIDTRGASESEFHIEPKPPKVYWPLISVYCLSSFIFCPMMIGSLYRNATKRYRRHAHMRFLDYYRAESVRNLTATPPPAAPVEVDAV